MAASLGSFCGPGSLFHHPPVPVGAGEPTRGAIPSSESAGEGATSQPCEPGPLLTSGGFRSARPQTLRRRSARGGGRGGGPGPRAVPAARPPLRQPLRRAAAGREGGRGGRGRAVPVRALPPAGGAQPSPPPAPAREGGGGGPACCNHGDAGSPAPPRPAPPRGRAARDWSGGGRSPSAP